MIAADHDGSFQPAIGDHAVHLEREARPFAIAQPTNARRQPLKMDALVGQRNPTREAGVIREQAAHQFIGGGDIVRIAGKRYPAKWATSFGE